MGFNHLRPGLHVVRVGVSYFQLIHNSLVIFQFLVHFCTYENCSSYKEEPKLL